MLHKTILMQTGEDKVADFKKGGEAADSPPFYLIADITAASECV